MEIITYVLNGALAHKDSLGNGSTIQPGDVQYMSAGQGVTHSEFNPDPKTESHFVQIWIQPSEIGAEPRYDQKHFDKRFKLNKLGLIAGPPGSGPLSLEIRQDAKILASILETGKKLSFSVSKNRAGYLQVLRGKVDLQGLTLNAGDAVFIDEPTESSVTGKSEMSELLFFDLSTRSNSMKKE
jgi:redox-sensitive bicupin YhaK (pirin superfamily)